MLTEPNQTLPLTLPVSEVFAYYMDVLKLQKKDNLVFYDDFGVAGACRAYWMMKNYGFENCFILDGGLQKWTYQLEKGN